MTPKETVEWAIARASLPPHDYDRAMSAFTVILRRNHRLEQAMKAMQSVCFEHTERLRTLNQSMSRHEERTVAHDIDFQPTTATPIPLTRRVRR